MGERFCEISHLYPYGPQNRMNFGCGTNHLMTNRAETKMLKMGAVFISINIKKNPAVLNHVYFCNRKYFAIVYICILVIYVVNTKNTPRVHLSSPGAPPFSVYVIMCAFVVSCVPGRGPSHLLEQKTFCCNLTVNVHHTDRCPMFPSNAEDKLWWTMNQNGMGSPDLPIYPRTILRLTQ